MQDHIIKIIGTFSVPLKQPMKNVVKHQLLMANVYCMICISTCTMIQVTSSLVVTSDKINACLCIRSKRISALRMLAWLHARAIS